MAAFFRSVRSGFNRQPELNTSGNNSQQRTNGMLPTAYSPTMSGLSPSTSFSSSTTPTTEAPPNTAEAQAIIQKPKFFFTEKYAKLGVRGNFMPLAAQPVHVDLADWLAHQTVEHYRLVQIMVNCVKEIDQNTGKPICNPESCPSMTAGPHTYTWLNSSKMPASVPAAQYIQLVQRWMDGKVYDPTVFPTGKPSASSTTVTSTSASEVPVDEDWFGREAGFPRSFLTDCRTCFRQMFRIYAHLYHDHWVEPFWHLSTGANSHSWTDLNSCFVHFCTVAKLYGLITDREAEPMQPLLNIWIANGSIPADAAKETRKIPIPTPAQQ